MSGAHVQRRKRKLTNPVRGEEEIVDYGFAVVVKYRVDNPWLIFPYLRLNATLEYLEDGKPRLLIIEGIRGWARGLF
ncbi:hypothetical protein [Infirmifilum sp.]|jgi:hypothetical protein|uniref:hypothetical protein n=1 Tax=Infirmifilum sp. TaxID=2856575 RepID=UPI003D14C96F